ncbi:integrase catalytic domain-containing protein [Trichonephila clavipes]|nr:integrase catalytic domain-containing protein [Trichonephila clavipes]
MCEEKEERSVDVIKETAKEDISREPLNLNNDESEEINQREIQREVGKPTRKPPFIRSVVMRKRPTMRKKVRLKSRRSDIDSQKYRKSVSSGEQPFTEICVPEKSAKEKPPLIRLPSLRRGKSKLVFSDNATNFVGIQLELKRLREIMSDCVSNLSKFLCEERVEWSFIPPRAPNHGGLWEAGVKAVKYHLRRVMGNFKIYIRRISNTILNQIEGVLSIHVPSTPCRVTLAILTPGHFLVGRPIPAIAEPSLTEVSDNRLKVWQKQTKILQHIWKRWSNNYLSTLQNRNKWYFEKNNVKIHDMVILKEDNLPVCNWPLGRILEVYHGKDNKIRVVLVKTKNGIFKRPITKLCILPFSTE